MKILIKIRNVAKTLSQNQSFNAAFDAKFRGGNRKFGAAFVTELGHFWEAIRLDCGRI